MASSTNAPSSSSSSLMASSGKATWEDDAWKIDSDDDEFVKASKAAAGTSSSSASSSSAAASGAAGGQANGSKYRGKGGDTSRHAPPARPHPFPLSSGTSRSSSREGQQKQQSSKRLSADQRESLGSSNSTATQTGWTLIERAGSAGSTSIGASPSPGPDTASGGGALNVRRGSESEAKQMIDAIRDDVDDVLRDPTQILSRLSISGKARRTPRSSSYSTTHEGDTSLSAATASSSHDVTSPMSPTHEIDGVITAVTGEHVLAAMPNGSHTKPNADIVTLPEGMLERRSSVRSERRRAKFIECLSEDTVQMDKLRALAWAGVPDDMRPMIWMLLLGYLPSAKSARASILARKRAEYQSGVRLAFQRGNESLDQAIWHQIHIDVPRTNPGIALWQRAATQRALERILYVWAIRHPASGYVQGINDLATPFFQVFLSAYITSNVETYDVALLPASALEALEADTFWCLSKLLDGIQDNYIFAQPGIQRQVRRMGELVGRINPALHGHLEEEGVEYMQFAFRWMNCLLMRELSVGNIVRMWDTYLAEGPDAFSDFHLYVCSSFLNRWDEELRRMDFQGIIMFLQSLPTQKWSAKETELLLADAFVKKSLFGGTAHLTN